jgi:hypothetical protein
VVGVAFAVSLTQSQEKALRELVVARLTRDNWALLAEFYLEDRLDDIVGPNDTNKVVAQKVFKYVRNRGCWSQLYAGLRECDYGAVNTFLDRVAPVAPPPQGGRDPLDSRHIGTDQYFVDRRQFRGAVRSLLKLHAQRILTVTGPESSGKSHSRRFLEYLVEQTDWPRWQQAPWNGQVDLAYFSFPSPPARVTPIQICQDVANRLEFSAQPPARPAARQTNRWVTGLAGWLADQLAQRARATWLVFDGLKRGQIAEETIDFISALAPEIVRPALARVRLILLDYSEPLPTAVAAHVETEVITVPPSTTELIIDFQYFGVQFDRNDLNAVCAQLGNEAANSPRNFWDHLVQFVILDLRKAVSLPTP